MKFIAVILFAACMQATPTKVPGSVYVCPTSGAIRYHLTPDCRGLSNCSKKVVKATLESAKKSGKTLCKWED